MRSSISSLCETCGVREKTIFCPLGPEWFSILSDQRNSRFFRKRQVLYYEGDPIVHLLCIRTGQVKVYKTTSEGKLHILRIAHGGEMLGLESLFVSESYPSSAEMLEDGVVCSVNKSQALELINKNPQIARRVMEILAAQVNASDEERVDLAQNSVRERMARLLMTLSEHYGIPVKAGICIRIPLSREEMADMIGTAAETAMRLLKEFREDHLVDVHRREIVILDRERLLKTAHLMI